MTVLETTSTTAGAPTKAGPAGSRLRPRGLTWLMWRQHRLLVWLGSAVVVVAAAGFAFLRAAMGSNIDRNRLVRCAAELVDPACQHDLRRPSLAMFPTEYGSTLSWIGLVLVLLPVVLGTFVGAPLFARELESGTWKLVLTQSVGRRRWLLAKLSAVGVSCAVVSGLLALLYRWLWLPAANDMSGIYWDSRPFVASGGPLLVATVLLGLAVGATAGTVLRRTVPAMAVSFVAIGLLQYGLGSVLGGRHTEPVGYLSTNDVWGVPQGWLEANGNRLPYVPCPNTAEFAGCRDAYAHNREFTNLSHAGDYWPMQLIESGICLVLAAALVVFTLRWSRRVLA